MKPSFCSFEAPLLEALRVGALSDGLRQHLSVCPACQQAGSAAHLLRLHAASVLAGLSPLPSSTGIWQKAQRRRQQQALRRASLAMHGMRALGIIYVAALALWGLHALWHVQPAAAQGALHTLTTGATPLGIAVAVTLLVLGGTSLVAIGHRPTRQLLP